MRLHRIYGITLRYLYLFRRNIDKSVDIFYWPLVDLILWGITTLYIRSLEPAFSQVAIMIVSGLIFWQVVWRGQIEITINILEELWNKNLINIFATPLKFSEWIASFIILGAIKLLISFSFISILAFFLYKVRIFEFGIYLLPFIFLLLMSGWCIGILVGAFILRFGTRIQNLAWSLPWAISPFSAVFYPVSILPVWAQKLSLLIPTSYVFEGMREVIFEGNMDPKKLGISLLLNIFYLAVSLLILKMSFNKILKRGLIKVY